MSLRSWRRHVHRVGRDLGVPHGARVPLVAALAGAALAGAFFRRNQFKAGDKAVLTVPGPSGGPTISVPVKVQKDASLFVGSLGIDGSVTIGPDGPAATAAFQLLFPGTTPGVIVTSAVVTASSLSSHTPSLLGA